MKAASAVIRKTVCSLLQGQTVINLLKDAFGISFMDRI